MIRCQAEYQVVLLQKVRSQGGINASDLTVCATCGRPAFGPSRTKSREERVKRKENRWEIIGEVRGAEKG